MFPWPVLMWKRGQILTGHFGLQEGLVFTLAKHWILLLEGTTSFRFQPPTDYEKQPFITLPCLRNVSDKSRVKTLVPVQSTFSNQRVASWKSQLKLISHRKYLLTINKQDYKLDRITSELFSVRHWRRTNMTYPVNLALSQEASMSTSEANIALFSLKTALIRCTVFKCIVSD